MGIRGGRDFYRSQAQPTPPKTETPAGASPSAAPAEAPLPEPARGEETAREPEEQPRDAATLCDLAMELAAHGPASKQLIRLIRGKVPHLSTTP